ncbi:MAG: hypothetical protein ACYS8Z_19485, partial [Planctomycetota bacterium]
MAGGKMFKIIVIVSLLALIISGTPTEAAFLDHFPSTPLTNYVGSNFYGTDGSYQIADGKLKIQTGNDNTYSVMTESAVRFGVGETLTLEVPPVSGSRGAFMMCSTAAENPDGTSTFGFRFRRGGGIVQMQLYPGGLQTDIADPAADKSATVCVTRTSDGGFDPSIIIEGARTQLSSFSLSALAGITNLHIGAQAYGSTSGLFVFDNLQVYKCADVFTDHFDGDTGIYTGENSYGDGGSFGISGGKLEITTGDDNTFSVMTTDYAAFCVGQTLSLDVPPTSELEGVFMMCSTSPGNPDGTNNFGFRFRRGSGIVQMQLYPGGLHTDMADPDPNKPATVCVTRTSDDGFDPFIIIDGSKSQLASFSLSDLAGIINLHIGAQAYARWSDSFTFHNLALGQEEEEEEPNCGDVFEDRFDGDAGIYTGENSYGDGGSFGISGGKLDITTGDDNTFSVMTTGHVAFCVGQTVSLDVPATGELEGVFMMCSTTAGNPDGTSTFGFRFRRGGGIIQMQLYPGELQTDMADPDPNKPATVCVTRTSDIDFDPSIIVDGAKTQLYSFSLPALAGITNLHIGGQAYARWSNSFTFDNLMLGQEEEPECGEVFTDHFDGDTGIYAGEDSHGDGGSFSISGGKLDISTGDDNTFSVMTTGHVAFCVGQTLSLDVPAIGELEGVFMMCSTTAGSPDGEATFGFRFRRGGGIVQMHLYPGDLQADIPDPDPNKPATVCVKRTSDTDFDPSIIVEGSKTQLDSFSLSALSGIMNLHIGAQAYARWSNSFAFDNLMLGQKEPECGDWGYHPMDFNFDCYVDALDFAFFADAWCDCTMPGQPGCVEVDREPFSIVILPDTQLYTQDDPDSLGWDRPCSRKEIFNQMTTWIAENTEELNIKFVVHVGDMVNVDADLDQWSDANE